MSTDFTNPQVPDPTWVPTVASPLPTYRCTAMTKAGERCKSYAIAGMKPDNAVCQSHGGDNLAIQYAAENRLDAARTILLDSAENAAKVLVALSDTATSEAVKLKAAESVLNRTVGQAPIEVRIEGEVTVDEGQKVKDMLARLIANKFEPREIDETVEADVVEEDEE